MAQFGQAARKKIQELSGEAYERELGRHLDELLDKFHAWKKDEIVSSELSHLIHKLDNGAARDVYNMYNYFDAEDIVARAVALEVFKKDERSKNIIEHIKQRINVYK